MLQETTRHRFVKKLTVTSIFITGIFGVSSIFYGSTQTRYEESLDLEKNLKALRISIAIDKSFNLRQDNQIAETCTPKKPETCKDTIESLITISNRLEDYIIFGTETLRLAEKSNSIQTLQDSRQKINKLSKKYFGIPLKAPNDEKFATIDQFIESINPNAIPDKHLVNELSTDFEGLRSGIIKSLDTFKDAIPKQPARDSSRDIALSLGILILLEILVFSCVNIIDIIINNADPEIGNEFNPGKIQAKVRPLALSIFLAFGVMVATQFVLISENRRITLSHCREVNKQDIQFLNLIQTYGTQNQVHAITDQFNLSQLCNRWIGDSERERVQELKKLGSSINPAEKIEVQSEIARIYADNFLNEEGKISSATKNILLFILLLNVMSMALLSLFLRMDSADIG